MVVHISSYNIPLARTQLHDSTQMQGILGNLVNLCAQEQEENGMLTETNIASLCLMAYQIFSFHSYVQWGEEKSN